MGHLFPLQVEICSLITVRDAVFPYLWAKVHLKNMQKAPRYVERLRFIFDRVAYYAVEYGRLAVEGIAVERERKTQFKEEFSRKYRK